MTNLPIRLLTKQDIQPISAAFAAQGWNKPSAQYERYWAEQEAGSRLVLLAWVDQQVVGYVTILWESSYPPFLAERIPEICDFNVLLAFRRRGIGSRLLDEAEAHIAQRSALAGIGVGMDGDYGAAQRLYVKRGYVPDGRGLFQHGRHLKWGDQATVDDDLVLYFTKRLTSARQG
jgi:ribosomal protein S18 acetylase RimI-like enzyme